VTYEEAICHADSQNELRLKIKLESKREERDLDEGIEGMQLEREAEGASGNLRQWNMPGV
jgi:twitching motility protein PilU